MGTDFDSFHANSTKEVERKFKLRISDTCNRRGEGNTYCGCMCQKSSLYWADETFADEAAAYAWIDENAAKHDSLAYVAGYFIPAKLTDAAKARIKKASDKIMAAKKAQNALYDKFHTDFKKAKSKFVKCRNENCQSSIRRSLVSHASCPVCHTSMLSPTCHKRLATHEVKVKKLQATTQALRDKAKKPTKKGLLVLAQR
jgi:hypothetical protein